MKQLNDLFGTKIEEVQILLANKIAVTKQRVVNLLNAIDILKTETGRKSESSRNLVKSLESLQLDANSNLALINNLKKENSSLHGTKFKQDVYISDLQKNLQEKDIIISELQKKNVELIIIIFLNSIFFLLF